MEIETVAVVIARLGRMKLGQMNSPASPALPFLNENAWPSRRPRFPIDFGFVAHFASSSIQSPLAMYARQVSKSYATDFLEKPLPLTR